MHYKGPVIAASLLRAFAASVAVTCRQEECDAVHIFIARGSTEPYPGRQSAVVDAVCADITSCGYEDIIYPATFEDYCNSAAAGVANGTAQVTAYAERCTDAKLVLTGYSQGAQVVGDILGGGGGPFQDCEQVFNEPLSPDTAPGSSVAAAAFFGDVRHTANQVYNAGTGVAGNGIRPREGSQLESLNKFSDKLRSWCLKDDPACAGGSNSSAHTAYFDIYVEEVAAWVKTKL